MTHTIEQIDKLLAIPDWKYHQDDVRTLLRSARDEIERLTEESELWEKASLCELMKERDQLKEQVKAAVDRLEDMLKGDDGQAWKEAERFVANYKEASKHD